MRHTVLVIDDQWSMQEFARIVLRTAGYRVLLANDAITGLCLARTEHPDVTVLDAQMAERYGGDLIDDFRHNPTTAEIPIILITSKPAEAAHAPTTATGVSSCLQKPFRPPDLLCMVDQALHQDGMQLAV